MELIKELVGTDKSQLEKDKRIKKAKNDFGFFCRYYLSDYFFEDAAEYQKLLYEVANTRSVSEDLAEKIKPFVNEKYQCLLSQRKNLQEQCLLSLANTEKMCVGVLGMCSGAF